MSISKGRGQAAPFYKGENSTLWVRLLQKLQQDANSQWLKSPLIPPT